jgi:hypothetical protein
LILTRDLDHGDDAELRSLLSEVSKLLAAYSKVTLNSEYLSSCDYFFLGGVKMTGWALKQKTDPVRNLFPSPDTTGQRQLPWPNP